MFIQLHPDDNVCILIADLNEGDELKLGQDSFSFSQNLCLGHKIALSDICVGSKVFKYGMSIGVASQAINRGEHVHLHNLKSEYTATFTLDEERQYAE